MDWDDARYFLAVARDGQMLGASRRLGVSQALLSRRVAALEAAVGTRLLHRTTRGSTLTEPGRTMFAAAERMEAAMLGAASQLSASQETVSGTIRIGAPDGFGSAFLAPRLKDLRLAYPALQVQLVPVPHAFSLSQREADMAVMVGRPQRGRLRVKKLTDYTLGLYASRGYLAANGTPESPEALRGHSLVGYVEDLIYTPDLDYAGGFLREWRSDIAVATAIGQFEVVRSGGGIGVLHDFMAVSAPELVRLLPALTARRTYWTVWHENMRTVRRLEVVAAFLEATTRAERARFLPQG